MPLPAIVKQREIIDRRALSEALTALAEDTATPDRAQVLALLRDALNRGRAEIQARFEGGGSAAHCVAEQCFLVDQLIRVLFDFVTEHVYPDRKSTRLNSSHMSISYAGFCLHKKKKNKYQILIIKKKKTKYTKNIYKE